VYARLLLGIIMSMEIMTLSDVEKLNGANFSLWKEKMEEILILRINIQGRNLHQCQMKNEISYIEIQLP